MGKNIANHRRTNATVRGNTSPSFGDEVLYLPWDDNAEYLRVRMFDEPPSKHPDDAERLGYAKLHIWDLIRDPTRSYSGTVKLRRDFESAGSLRIEATVISNINLPYRNRLCFDVHQGSLQPIGSENWPCRSKWSCLRHL